MRPGLRLALCQINATVGDLDGNATLIANGIEQAKRAGAQLVLFPELALTGYPPEDLLLREHFLTDTGTRLQELAAQAEGIVAIVGFPERISGAERRPAPGTAGPIATVLHNAAAVLADGAVSSVYRKVHLPNYGVFDEQRYFRAGEPSGTTIELGEHTVGLTVCEDLWVAGAPATAEAARGAGLIANISASPYHAGKGTERERLFAQRARETGAHVAFCAMVGGQDELVFDGHSFVLDPTGETIGRAAQFEQDMLVCDLALDFLGGMGRSQVPDTHSSQRARSATPAPAHAVGTLSPAAGQTASGQTASGQTTLAQSPAPVHAPMSASAQPATPAQAAVPLRTPISPMEREIYEALRLGLRDYAQKNGFAAVVLGLSGGIDSALVACLAADALGAERVNVAVMPSPYSSSATQDDARALAKALGAKTHEYAIQSTMDAYMQTLQSDFEGLATNLTEENLQARIRGNLLMALSNKFGWLVLTTGNKSEMSVGYTTLYGDLAGGFAVIKDVPKTLVYRLARWRNDSGGAFASAPIPASIIERAPSAELRENQTDQDSLPPYDMLDRILHGYVELDHGREQLIAEGLPAEDVERTARLVDLAEYKRRQAPPGIKITERAFGRDRRMPITNAYKG
jgi:NAD+ synthase (glutamine-hydrolysing)